MTGYSGMPLAAKLGIKAGMAVRSYRRELGANTPAWISWPKKTSQVPTDITEDTIRVKLVVRKELR